MQILQRIPGRKKYLVGGIVRPCRSLRNKVQGEHLCITSPLLSHQAILEKVSLEQGQELLVYALKRNRV